MNSLTSSNKIMVGITTYNRKDILERFANSFNEIDNLEKMHICIFDDASSEFDEVFLKKIFKKIDYIHRNNDNILADLNTSQMFNYFLESDCDIFLNADSDLLFNKNIFSVISEYLPKTDGIFSLFNTPQHAIIEETADGLFVKKETLGAAGVVITKQLVKMIIDAKCGENNTGFDWGFSKYLKSKNIRLLATKESFCQHIGFCGQNTDYYHLFDYGVGFKIDSLIDAQNIEYIAESIFSRDHLILNINKRYIDILLDICRILFRITKIHCLEKLR